MCLRGASCATPRRRRLGRRHEGRAAQLFSPARDRKAKYFRAPKRGVADYRSQEFARVLGENCCVCARLASNCEGSPQTWRSLDTGSIPTRVGCGSFGPSQGLASSTCALTARIGASSSGFSVTRSMGTTSIGSIAHNCHVPTCAYSGTR